VTKLLHYHYHIFLPGVCLFCTDILVKLLVLLNSLVTFGAVYSSIIVTPGHFIDKATYGLVIFKM
jgi:hypothetical protein